MMILLVVFILIAPDDFFEVRSQIATGVADNCIQRTAKHLSEPGKMNVPGGRGHVTGRTREVSVGELSRALGGVYA